MIDFADLSVRVRYDDATKATRALEQLAVAGTKAEQSTNRLGVSSVAQTRNMGAWAAIQAEAAGHVGAHSLSIGRLEKALASIVGHFVGANNAAELLASGFLKFSVGTLGAVGVLAGLAAVVGLYELITAGAREAKKQMDDMTKSLVDQARAAQEATLAGRDNLKLIAELNQQAVQKEPSTGWRTFLERAFLGSTNIGVNPTDRGNHEKRVADAQTAVDQATKNWTDAWAKAEEERTRKAEEEERKRAAAFAKYSEAAGKRSAEAAEKQGQLSVAAWNHELDLRSARRASPVANTSVGLLSGLIGQQQLRDEKNLKAAEEHAKKLQDAVWGAASASAQTIVSALNIGGGGKGSSIGGALGSAAGGAAGYYFGGQAGQIVGSAVGNIFGSLIGGLFDTGKAAREAAKAQQNINLQLDQIAANLSHNKLASSLLGIEAQLQSTIAAFNAALPGSRNEAQRNADIARAKALAGQQEQQAREDYARNQKYAGEDLTVRNLRALGRGDEAGLLAFREQQQRELTQAILDGRDATYQSNLLTTQNNELLAYQNGLLSDALRNSPTGWFGPNSYLGQYATPRGPSNYPTDSGPNPVSPVNPTGGLTPPGGRTVNLVVDGRVLASIVVGQIDRAAAATGGSGSSRSDALNRMAI